MAILQKAQVKAESQAKVKQAKVKQAKVKQAKVEEAKVEEAKTTSLFIEVLHQICTKVLSRKELAEIQGLSNFAGNLNRILSQLQVLGFIERTHQKPRAHNQAYRITDKGRQFLDNMPKQTS